MSSSPVAVQISERFKLILRRLMSSSPVGVQIAERLEFDSAIAAPHHPTRMEAFFAHVREEIFRGRPHDEFGMFEHSGAHAARDGAGRLEAGADGRFVILGEVGRLEGGIVDGGFEVLGVVEMEPGVHLDFDVHDEGLSANDAGDGQAVRGRS